jgi:hypothetical protein
LHDYGYHGRLNQRFGERPMATTSPCYLCRASTPREALVRQKVFKGFNGRQKSGFVLMCQSCSGVGGGPTTAPSHGPTGGASMKDHNMVVAGISIVVMVIATVIVIAVRGY